MSVLGVYREFGSLDAPHWRMVPDGLTIAAMARRMPELPADFDTRGVVCINGHVVPRAVWGMVKPKPFVAGVRTEVTFHAPPMGGGDDGGKSILAIVAGIALTALTGFVAGGGLAAKFGFSAKLLGAGTIGAQLAAAGVSLAGSLLISALVPPPSIKTGRQKSIINPGAASADGNILEPNGAVPRVFGRRKVFPPLACEPLTYFDGQDEVVEAVYVLSGPHEITDIRVGAAPIATLTDVEYEVREGWPGDDRVTLISRQARTDQTQAEIRGHTVAASDGRTLESTTGDTTSALPQRQTVATREAPDEHWLHLTWTGGLHKNAKETDYLRVPFRIRIRPIGATDWTNLPEIHYQAANVRQLRATVRLLWVSDATTGPSAAAQEGWVEARIATPAQTVAPASPAFAADSYFSTGSGDSWMSSANLGTTGVDHVILNRFNADFYLDETVFPRGRYEIEIRRGAQFLNANYSASAYTISGTVLDPFAYAGTPGQIPQTRDGVSDTVYLLRSVSVWNEHPLPTDDFAAVAVRARNRQMDRVSCVAGGWVKDWDGSGWNSWVVTDNPAPHLRDIYTGDQNLDPVPAEVVDDAGLVAWRSHCAAKGYRVNALIEDGSVDDAARIVAACGYARPYMSEIWGVTQDYDRSAEAPVQIFTPRNSSGFEWTKAFARVPDGFRVNFRDADRDYDARQITVFRDGISSDTGRLEQVTYEGLVTEAEVTARAVYDQAQATQRSVFYSLQAPAEAIVCRRGSLVGVQHDSLDSQTGSGRVIDVGIDGSGNVTSITLDASVPILNEPDMLSVANMLTVSDLLAVGARTAAVIRRDGSRTIHAVSNATGETDTLTFSPAISAAGLSEGALVATGNLGSETLRLIVFSIAPNDELTATLTLVDEAPGIVPDLAA